MPVETGHIGDIGRQVQPIAEQDINELAPVFGEAGRVWW